MRSPASSCILRLPERALARPRSRDFKATGVRRYQNVHADSASPRGRHRALLRRGARLLGAIFMVVWVTGCASTARSIGGLESAPFSTTEALQVFDRVDYLVQTRHFSRQFNGANWPALQSQYRPLIAAAADDEEVYRLLNEMLRSLHDSHTYAHCPVHHPVVSFPEERAVATSAPIGHGANVLANGVLYLRFDHFDADSVRWLERQISAHREAPGLVIDLRRNIGGLVTSGQQMVGSFFDHRVPMGLVIPRSGRAYVEQSKVRRIRYLGPLCLLIGPHSYSSAEVFADVLQSQRRATTVGEQTAGQVRGSRHFGLPDGGNLQLSVSDYRRLDGRPLEGCGVAPDVVVLPAPEDFDLARDPTVRVALDVLAAR